MIDVLNHFHFHHIIYTLHNYLYCPKASVFSLQSLYDWYFLSWNIYQWYKVVTRYKANNFLKITYNISSFLNMEIIISLFVYCLLFFLTWCSSIGNTKNVKYLRVGHQNKYKYHVYEKPETEKKIQTTTLQKYISKKNAAFLCLGLLSYLCFF